MKFASIISSLLKGKVLVTALLGVTLLGGATVAAAASPAGRQAIHAVMGDHAATPGANQGKDDQATKDVDNACPGEKEAQDLAQKFHLSTSAKGNGIQTICALHDGTFKGTTSTGAAVSSSKKLGYGEIDQLLTYAQFLAKKASTGGALSDINVKTFVADALKSCGSTPFMQCLKTNIPGFQPGSGKDNGNADNNKDNSNNGSGNGDDHGKPTVTPTPPSSSGDHGKPTVTPTLPVAVPTPHH